MAVPTITPTAAGDTVAGGAIIGTLMGYLPVFVAIIGGIWYLIQIWESKTVQEWWLRRQAANKVRKIASLQSQQKIIVAELEALEVVRAAQVLASEKVETAKAEAAVEIVVKKTAAAVKDISGPPAR